MLQTQVLPWLHWSGTEAAVAKIEASSLNWPPWTSSRGHQKDDFTNTRQKAGMQSHYEQWWKRGGDRMASVSAVEEIHHWVLHLRASPVQKFLLVHLKNVSDVLIRKERTTALVNNRSMKVRLAEANPSTIHVSLNLKQVT